MTDRTLVNFFIKAANKKIPSDEVARKNVCLLILSIHTVSS